jgi:hypothetical protein
MHCHIGITTYLNLQSRFWYILDLDSIHSSFASLGKSLGGDNCLCLSVYLFILIRFIHSGLDVGLVPWFGSVSNKGWYGNHFNLLVSFVRSTFDLSPAFSTQYLHIFRKVDPISYCYYYYTKPSEPERNTGRRWIPKKNCTIPSSPMTAWASHHHLL